MRAKPRHGLRSREPNHLPIGSLICAALALVLGFVVLLGDDPAGWYRRFGLVPRLFWVAWEQPLGEFFRGDRWYTPLTAIFLHLDWIHLIGNGAFFWLFAQRIERRTGALWFVLLVAGCGGLANLVSAWHFPESGAPIIGASGATAALMGAFVVLYPTTRIGVILPLGFYWQQTRIPGMVLVGSWFLLQVLYTVASDRAAPIAWWTHLAGFGSGLILAGIGRILGLIRR